MEIEERDRHAVANRMRDPQLPRTKTLEEFAFARAPKIAAARIRELAEGEYIDRREPVVLIGEYVTGGSSAAGCAGSRWGSQQKQGGALLARRRCLDLKFRVGEEAGR
jgi:hypothetical protein